MTVSTTTSQVSYAGDGVTDTFAYTFKIFEDSDLVVILINNTTGIEDTQILMTDYSVTGAGEDTGGNVVFVTEPESGYTVVIRRELSLTQETDYLEGDIFPAETHEAALDYEMMVSQQIQREQNRSLKLSLLSGSVDGTCPVPSPGYALGWNSGADGLTNIASAGALSVSTFGQNIIKAADADAVRVLLDLDDIFDYWLREHGATGIHTIGRNFINGLILSNDAGDTEHDISVTTGACRDSTNAYTLINDSAFIKQIDTNWAAGTGNGGFPSGLGLASDTWYLYFLIAKTDGTVDFGFDTDPSATNLLSDATGYTLYRRIGFVLTDGSSNIVQFFQWGDIFTWTAPLLISDTSPTATEAGESYTVGPPIETMILANLEAPRSSSSITAAYLRSPNADDDLPANFALPLATTGLYIDTSATKNLISSQGMGWIFTNSVGEIKGSVGNAATDLYIAIISYLDLRGKQ